MRQGQGFYTTCIIEDQERIRTEYINAATLFGFQPEGCLPGIADFQCSDSEVQLPIGSPLGGLVDGSGYSG